MANVPPNIMKMILTYRQSQSRLIDIIAKAELKGNVTAYRKAVLQDVNQELGALNDYAKKWMRNEVPIAYGAGADEAFKAYVEANINPVKIYTNKKAIDGIINSATGQLTDASQYVGRRINDLLKEAGSEAISEKLSSGDTVRQAKALMLKKMSDKGITAIKDKRGREIALDAYASMVARTTTREATNIGTLNAVQEVGGDLVQITSHNSPCPICSVYEGRIYSISGNDKRYPPLDAAFSSGYSTLHPNCIHSVTPYFEQFDDEAEENRKKSNLPFEVDPKRKSELDAYYEDQKAKARKRADYRMWEKAKMLAPDDAPKTFSGFRSMKRANSERYQQIRMRINQANKADVVQKAVLKTNDEIINSLEAKGITIKTNIFTGVDRELMTDNLRSIDDLSDKYPKISEAFKEKTTSISTVNLSGNTMARVVSNDSVLNIEYNRPHMKSKADSISAHKRLQDSGWLTKASDGLSATYNTNHEIGHVVHDYLTDEIKNANKVFYDAKYAEVRNRAWSSRGQAMKAWRKIDEDLITSINNEVIQIAKESNAGVKITRASLGSSYGMSKPEEWFAEAFANAESGAPNEIGIAMQKYLGVKMK